MGNTALKEKFGFEGQRMSAQEYEFVCNQLRQGLPFATKDRFRGVKIIPSYEFKKDHGDVDCVTMDRDANNFENMSRKIKETYKARYVRKNSNVYSFDFLEKYQIDLAVFEDTKPYHAYLSFCSYSPIGNCMGYMLKQAGLKWGIDGLTYPVKLSDSEQLGCIPISTNLESVVEFFESDVGYGNFYEERDIFRFLTGSRFFSKDIFAFENLNSINKNRNAKRGDYNRWLEYIKDMKNTFIGDPDKTVYIKEISKHFSVDILDKWKKMLGDHLVKKDMASKFSGSLVMEVTGAEGKDLGNIIRAFKDHNGPLDSDYILTHTKEQVEARFVDWYKLNK